MEQRTVRPRIDDVAREAGVSKTAVSFAFNSPERLAPETAEPDPRGRRTARLHAPPGRPDADPGRDADDRSGHAAAAVGRLLEPVLRCVRGRASARRPRRPATRSSSSPRCVARWPARCSHATVDGVVAVGLSGDHPEVDEIRRAGVPVVLVDSTACREMELGRGRRRRRGARGRRHISSGSVTATSSSSASSPDPRLGPAIRPRPERRHRPSPGRLPRGARRGRGRTR